MEGGPVGAQIQELHARLRGLRERAETARREKNASYSQNTVQAHVQASGRPGVERFRGKRISDWAPQDPDGFKVPQADSVDLVVALVALWSKWTGEAVDEWWWREQLELARTEQAQERPGQSSPENEPDGGRSLETLTTVGAAALEVHQAVLPATGASPGPTLPTLTPYLLRAHDSELRTALGPPLAGGPSVLAVLTGDSSTGKTRALYEALLALAPDRPLLRPHSAEDLLGLLRANQVTAGVVLWLNETQRFLYGQDSERTAAEVLRLLEHRPGVAAVGTLWNEPYWADLTRHGVPGDPHSHARALLTGPATRRIPVDSDLSNQDQTRWRELARRREDRRLADALDPGAPDGRVVQHLSGGPELLAAYLHGPGAHFPPVEHALLTAALDARRLGHRTPLPADLLADAADGALTKRHRTGDPAWADLALGALSTGKRLDGSRTDIRHTLTALTALRTRSGTPPHYEPADYLDQHTRHRGPARHPLPVESPARPHHRPRRPAPDRRRRLAPSPV
ncbi:hypothetical protein OG729_00665 [Streptomyces sp. NBC_00210]|uniref:hypothetical protein n=1 Tax=Streptomyces sp. NBC_00210 TaxID=2903636 RepID=UPI003249DF7D